MSFVFDSLINLPFSLACDILNNWLSIEHIAKLDSACCSSYKRQYFLKILSSREFLQHDQITISNTPQFDWYVRRTIAASNILVDDELCVDDDLSRYLWVWGQNIREIHFSPDASGELHLFSVHCRNLRSVTCRVDDMAHVLNDILRYNPALEEVAFLNVSITSLVLEDVSFPQLRVLRFSGLIDLGKKLAQAIGQLGEELLCLSLTDVVLENPELIIDITMRYKNLRSLDLTDTNVTGSCVAAVALLCPRIMHLALRQCSLVDDACILTISQQLSLLRTLEIRDCTELTNNSLRHLADHCAAQLTNLFFSCASFRLSSVAGLLQKCSSLHTLGLQASDDIHYADVDLRDIFQALSSLQQLHLRGAGLIADHVLHLVGQYCSSLTHIALRPIADPEPEEVEVDVYFTAMGLFALREGCPNLVTLIVYKECPFLKNELAIMMWQASHRGFCITCNDSIDYDAMQCDF